METNAWSMISAIAAMLALGLGVYNMLTSRSRREYDDLIKTASGHEKRLSEVEGSMRHAPAPSEFAEMRVSMAELKGQVAVVAERVKPIQAIAERLQESLLERSGQK
jgi:hypothetical protein